jgi:hypothetical protein
MGIVNIKAKATADKEAGTKAIARLKEYKAKLKAQLDRCYRNSWSADLLNYAYDRGELDDIPMRLLLAENINIVMLEIDNIISQIESDIGTSMRERNDAALLARRTEARKVYQTKLAEFEANYAKLSKLPDRTKFLNAAEELSRVAWEALMIPDLREHFRVKWGGWYRAGELERF